MEEQQQPAPLQINDLHISGFSHGAEAASPHSTIPFDEDTPQQPSSERPLHNEEASETESFLIPVIEISDGEEDRHARLSRPRRPNTHHDYSYQDYQDIMAISASSLGKRRREDSDAPRFPSKIEKDEWKKKERQLQLQIQYRNDKLTDKSGAIF
uniref:Uncharacterized protein n=1 Tax=Talaromyces marneffei PM1 TaxID=1077442 RepID=A0A093USC4_TALMA